MLVLLPEVSEVPRGEEFCDEVDALALAVVPGAVALDDIWVVQINALFKLSHNCCHLLIAEPIGFPQYPAPGNVNALLQVKALVNVLESP